MRRQLVYCSNHGGLMGLGHEKVFTCTEQANWDRPHKPGIYAVSWCLIRIKTGKAFEAMSITTNPDKLIETWEVLELHNRVAAEAMVSCTPYWNDRAVLPTLEVPYADRMVWEWEIHQRCRIDKVVVVAKVRHQFSLQAHPRKSDTVVFYLYAKDLDHGH